MLINLASLKDREGSARDRLLQYKRYMSLLSLRIKNNNMTKKDTISILIIGVLVGLSIVPFLIDTGQNVRINNLVGFNILWFLPIIVPVLAFISLFIVTIVAKRIPILTQVGKFVSVGISNTTIDFGVFSLLKIATGATMGLPIIIVNVLAFGLAILNSYLWNKFWTFKKTDTEKVRKEAIQFFVVSMVGVAINTAIVYIGTTWVGPQFGINEKLWATLTKIGATPATLIWNFMGYKFIVFKK